MKTLLFFAQTSWLLTTAAVMIAGGCSRPPDKWEQARLRTLPTTGRVMLDGQPVSQATVIFRNDAVPTSPSALTSDDGSFKLQTYKPKDGAPVGTYAVSIAKTTETQSLPADPEAALPPVEITHHLPKRYRDAKTSGFTAEVTEQGPNTFVLELSTK